MMRKLVFAILLSTLVLVAERAGAQSTSGKFFIKACSGTAIHDAYENWQSEEGARGRICIGFVHGFLQGYILATRSGKTICPPTQEHINYEMAGILVRYLHNHPEDRQQDAAVLLKRALAAAWPCRN